ncbi:unnamed protein product [Chrysodeixis includens]|uniref:UDP-glucuronosyltransferase n=1 Tax=Chrysodeixis includens TaxID=689277 RepID=A0A9P0BWG3_CHRIL|nr:unnamed protein product [Chrysodeixis includens]
MKLCILLLAVVSCAHAYHILVWAPLPSHSHNTLGKGIVDALLKAGHEITWVTGFPEKVGKNPPKTLHIIDASITREYVSDMNMLTNEKMDIGFIKQFARNVTMAGLEVPALKEALIKTQFDAVVTEAFFCDVHAGVAAVQQVPWILFNGVQLSPFLEAQVDDVRSIATVPLMFNDSPMPMGFLNRAVNVFIYTAIAVRQIWSRHEDVALYESTFAPIAAARGVALPPFEDAHHNVSILLVNAHESLTPAFSTPPNVINIAGYHFDENPAPLPKDLQDLLDSAKNGFVYFSMGSVVKSAMLPEQTRLALIKIFSKLPYTVLWKFEEPISGLPKNVHVRPWLPQPSVLAHPNIKLFITHGGQLSALEAVHAGVPMLAVPVFGDQPSNAERAVRGGYARRVDFHVNMAEDFEAALKDLLSTDKYYKRVKELSKLFRARAVAPSHLIKHYVELAIETKGAYHLRSIALKYKWYERWMLDVLLAFIIAVTAVSLLTKFAVNTLLSKLTGNKKTSFNNKQKAKKRN